jgi:TldD protein
VDKLGTLQYGSPVMHVTGDRTAPHGLSTIGWDDEGVAGQRWDIVRDGVLVGYQVDRNMARLRGMDRSNGCAFADSPQHTPVQRMANVSLQPAPDGPTTDELVAGVERGIYVVGDKSWSIDMQRYNFQFTGQRFYRIEGGSWPASSATWPTRRRRRTSGARCASSAARRRTGSAAPSTAARASPGRSPRSATAARWRCSRT